MPQISIIVPVYNTEKYLHRCIKSILSQSFTDFELLLINDGSTDNSGGICDEYSNKDNRIQVIHKPNAGVSDTRNRGLDIAQGKYILFLDADDYWYEKTALETLVLTAEKHNLDIVRGEYKAVDKDGNDLFCRKLTENRAENLGKVLGNSVFLDKIIEREFFLPLCLIKKDCIKDIRFNTNRIFLEDIEFFIKLLEKPIKSMYIGKRFYAYRKHQSSVSSRNIKKKLEDAFNLCDVYCTLENRIEDKDLKKSYIMRAADYYIRTLRTISEVKEFYQKRAELCNDFQLNKLRNTIITKSKEYSTTPLLLYTTPIYIIYYYRITAIIKNTIKKLLNK